MFNPFKPLELIKAEVFTSVPGKLRKKGRTSWSDPNRQNAEVECFLEGPAFDREGNLFIVEPLSSASSASRRKATGTWSCNTTAGRTA